MTRQLVNPPPMPLTFVLPNDPDSPSGGNLYNRFLISALRDIGVEVRVLNFGSFASDHAAGLFLVDSLLMEPLTWKLSRQPELPDVLLIIHSLPSLDPDLSESERVRQIARERLLSERLSGLIVTSGFTRRTLRIQHGISKPIIVIPPAMCIRPKRARVPREHFTGLMVANLIRSKGVIEFLEELAARIEPRDKLTINIVGRADIEPDYARAALSFLGDHPTLSVRVHYLGALDADRMRSLYEQSTILISPSKMETFGMALAEARAFGLPILTLDAGNAPAHVYNGMNGYLFSTIPSLAAACVDLSRDVPACRTLQERAISSASDDSYTWRTAAETLCLELAALHAEY